MRGAKQQIDPTSLAITGVVLSIVLFLMFTVYRKLTGKMAQLEGPVEFTGPRFNIEAAGLLLLGLLILVVVAMASRYMGGETA